MDELVSDCQQKLETFRIKELKDVLSHIGLAKQGRKQLLIDRIIEFIHSPTNRLPEPMTETVARRIRKEVAKLIDDTYRIMRGQGASDLATTAVGGRPPCSSFLLISTEPELQQKERTRCPCGSSVDAGTMIQCDDPNCMVWQHLSCVLIPENEEAGHTIPPRFYCEICRVQLGDPFCVAVAHPMLPLRMNTSMVGGDRSVPLQNVEKSFTLSRKDLEICHKANHDIQIWSLLLNDKVPFRMHWPLHVEVRVNGFLVRVINRPGHQALGKNGRDDGARIADHVREGTNNVSASASDGRPFCMGVRVIRRLTVDQILSLIPKEFEGESFDTALTRVRRCIGGSKSESGDADSDSDLEVVSECVSANLRCPMSGLRMHLAGRFRPCTHMGCFDLRTFVELNQRTRKWQCPICLTNYLLGDLIIDPFFTCICRTMQSYGEDVTEVELKPSGVWRPKQVGDVRVQERWHSPDGSMCKSNENYKDDGQNSNLFAPSNGQLEEALADVREELKIGIKRTDDGSWQANKIRRMLGSRSSDVFEEDEMQECGVKSQGRSNDVFGDDETQEYGVKSQGRSTTASSSENVFHGPKSSDRDVASSFEKPPLVEGEHAETADVIVLSDTDDDDMEEHASVNQRATRLASPGLTVETGENERVPEVEAPIFNVDSFQENSSQLIDAIGLRRSLDNGDRCSLHAQDSAVGSLGSLSTNVSMEVSNRGRVCHQTSAQTCHSSNYGLTGRQEQQAMDTLEAEAVGYIQTRESPRTPEHQRDLPEETRRLELGESLEFSRTHKLARPSVEPNHEEPGRAWGHYVKGENYSLGLSHGNKASVKSPGMGGLSHQSDRPSQERRHNDAFADLGPSGDCTYLQKNASAIHGRRSAVHPRRYYQVESDSD